MPEPPIEEGDPVQRCVHCGVTSTPLWRAGPAGPKTLCNACGVRWKKTGSVVPRVRRTIAKPAPSAPRTRAPQPVRAAVTVTGGAAAARQPPEGTYESIFAGLMEVPRPARARTRTPRAQMFFDGIAATRNVAPSPPPLIPSPSPLPRSSSAGAAGVYVTETLAPSPSPSPPPLPRMEHFPEGQGFRLVMHTKPDEDA